MARSSTEVVAEILAFTPKGEDWRPLDALIGELWAAGQPERYIGDLLTTLERFPEDNGAGVWSVVHGLELSCTFTSGF